MDSLVFNGNEIEAMPGENVIQAARRAGIEIPHYCWHSELSVVASCRMCLVELGERKPDGSIAMLPRLVPACQTPAKANTVVLTDSEKVKSAQAQTLEYLLLNHPLDCSICDQAGECYLQDYTYKFGNSQSRLQEPKVQRVDKYHIGEQIALFTDRCVMCTRCVRFTREISGTSELHVVNRGSVEEIDVFPGHACDNKLAGNVVDLCPVGALCSKDFLYKKRVWWLSNGNSVCPGCSTGCSINLDQNENKLYRIRPRSNPKAQGEFMCDDGRFGWKYIYGPDRLTAPRLGKAEGAIGLQVASLQENASQKEGASSNGVSDQLAFHDPWIKVLESLTARLQSVAKKEGDKFVGLFSPFMSTEEAYLLASYLRSIDKRIGLAMGPIPMVGEDDCYPKDCRGAAPAADKVRFTIRAEKCPNRRGVMEVLRHFQSSPFTFEDFVERMRQGRITGAFMVGGYPEGWPEEKWGASLDGLQLLVVQDFVKSSLTEKADFVLASAAFAEREGSFVNHAGLAQSFQAAIRPPQDARAEGRVYMELLQRKGLYHPASIRKEMAATISAFQGWGDGELGEEGVKVLP